MASLAQQMAARGEKVPGTGRNFYEKLGVEKYVYDRVEPLLFCVVPSCPVFREESEQRERELLPQSLPCW